jgi:type I restriction enzyme S subunit
MLKLELPSGWKSVKLSEIADKCIAKNRDFTHSLVLTNSAQSGIIPQSEHFDKNIAVDENIDGYFIVNDGEFVYNPRISATAPCGPIRRNHLGKTGIMSPLYTVFKLRNDIINDTYIEYYFLSSAWYRYMKSIANYGARHDRMSITDDNFFAMSIPLPPLSEQQTIAEILTIADKLIAVKERLIVAKQKQKQWLMQNLLTRKIRLPKFSKKWEHVKLGNITDIDVGQSPNNTDIGCYPFINAGTTPSGYLSTYNTEPDTITTPSRGQGGIGFVSYQAGRFWCGPLSYRIRSKNKDLFIRYLYYWLSNNIEHIVGMAHMSGLPALNKKELIDLYIFSPPLPEQQAITNILTTADREIELLKKELEQQKQIKKYLMQKLLTGKIRVKGAEV